MPKNLILKALFSALLSAVTGTMLAQHGWVMATIEDGKNMPSFTEFHCLPEKGANDIYYHRIYDESSRLGQEYYNPVKLQYGYRMENKRIFVYDFEKDEERLAFDFTLSVGNRFSTYNGMEWEVEAVMDTLVNLSYMGKGESCTKRLLKVRSVDGKYSDQWLEDFGSFSNHFMILPMNETLQTQTLWMEYEEGQYLTREISLDPLFTHDSGAPRDESGAFNGLFVNCTYKDGTLVVEDERYRSPNREYTCFYRVGDDIYCAYVWNLNPATEAAYVVWYRDIAYYYGLPDPPSGKYTMHFNMNERPTDKVTKIADVIGVVSNHLTKSPLYDLTGRPVAAPAKGIYIQNGRKVILTTEK